MKPDLVHVSKFLSLVLRHQPDQIGLELDSQGGHVFYCSANGVWLTDRVPVAYIDFP